jgi:hypothetical protein
MVFIRHAYSDQKSTITGRAWLNGPFEWPSSYPQLCWWSLIGDDSSQSLAQKKKAFVVLADQE